MKTYSELLESVKGKHAVVVMDAHPFNRGAVEHALTQNGEKHIFVHEPKNPKLDPLSAKDKHTLLTTMYPAHKASFKVANPEHKTPYHLLDHMANKENCTHCTVVTDPDKHEEHTAKFTKQNGKFNASPDGKQRAGYAFNKLKVVAHPGKCCDDREKVHKAALNNDWLGVSSALPVGQFSDEAVHGLMGKIRRSMSDVIADPAKKVNESEELDEAKKLIGTYSHPTNGSTTKVYKHTGEDDDGDPYHVKLFKGGKHYEPADYFTNDADDAHGTAKHMVSEANHWTNLPPHPSIKNPTDTEAKRERDALVKKIEARKAAGQKPYDMEDAFSSPGSVQKKKVVVSINRPVTATISDVGAGGKEYNKRAVESFELEEKTVYDPITKKNVKVKAIKQQAGGSVTRNGVPVTVGPSKKWTTEMQRQHIIDRMKAESFEIGNIVETQDGKTAEVINVGPNYVTLVAEGKTFRKWNTEVTLSEGKKPTTRLNRENFIIKGYKTKNFNRELSEQFSSTFKESEDSYAVYNLVVCLDNLLGMTQETIKENFETYRKNFDRTVKYARRFDMKIEQLSDIEDALLEHSICEGFNFSPVDKMKLAKIISITAGLNEIAGEPHEIINDAVQLFKEDAHSVEAWKLFGGMLNHSSNAGIKWNKEILSKSTQHAMGIK